MWRRENSHQLLLGEELVSVLNNLVGSGDQIDSESFALGFHDIRSKDIGDSADIGCPVDDAAVRITPEEIDVEGRTWRIHGTGKVSEHVETGQFGRETSVHAQDTTGDETREGHGRERFLERHPETGARISLVALFKEPVDTVDRRTFVVAPEQEETVVELDLVAEEQGDQLEILPATVHVVPKEYVVGVWRETGDVE